VSLDPGKHFCKLKRLADEVNTPSIETLDLLYGIVKTAHEIDRYADGALVAFQTTAYPISIHVQHFDIQEDQAWYLDTIQIR